MSKESVMVPNAEFKDITCKYCGYMGKPENTGNTNEVHGYALRCPVCKKFWGWGGKKKELKDHTGKRELSSIWSAKRLCVDHCQLCLRKRDHLGDLEQLETHHVIPVADGGEDSPSNIWIVCTACHKHIHHQRTYYNLHLMKFFESFMRADSYDQP